MLEVTTKKREDGHHWVFVNGRQTQIVITKGDAPKFGMRQEWAIGVQHDNMISWLTHDQPGKAYALATVKDLLKAGSQ